MVRVLKVQGDEGTLVAMENREIYLEVDLEGAKVTVDTCERYATPECVYHGRTRQFRIIDPISVSAANNLLEDETVLALAQRMVDGARIERDDPGNLRGRLDDAAQDAEEELERYIERYEWMPHELVSEWYAGDWLDGTSIDEVSKLVKVDVCRATDEEIEVAAAAYEEQEVIDDNTGGPMILSGTAAHLRYLRDWCCPDEEGEEDE